MTFPTWSPLSFAITAITNANPGVVTTSQPHGYLSGLYVRIVLPGNFGMNELNGNVYLITVLSTTTFAINANTQDFPPFSLSGNEQVPQVIPVGEVANSLLQAEKNAQIPFGGGI